MNCEGGIGQNAGRIDQSGRVDKRSILLTSFNQIYLAVSNIILIFAASN
jgi:hypothetical protein